ncbi:MAG: hypothetical protein Q7S92_01420 [Candidatus Diapherotrites archaeon]|nr:hypothetical protein [Candidatus Diapherotrites archaeon]
MFWVQTSLPKIAANIHQNNSLFYLQQQSLPGSDNLGQAIPDAAANLTQSQLTSWAGNHWILIAGIVLVVLAVIVLFLVRQILINSVLGLIVFAIAKFVFNIDLPLIPSLILSIVFGLAGIGCLLVLKFLGVL